MSTLPEEKEVRELIGRELRARADWLRSEYLAGGNREHLSAREEECRWLAGKIEKGLTP